MLVIYRVFNKQSQKSYIGKCSKGLDRVKQHFSDYHNPKLEYRAKLLYRAMNKYGEENFSYEILFNASSVEELNEKEKEFIIKFDSRNPKKGYNIAEGGTGGNMWAGISPEERARRIEKQVINQKLGYTPERRKESAKRMRKMRADPKKSKKNAEVASQRLKILNKTDPRFTNANKIKVKCLENNTIYESYKEAAKILNITTYIVSKSIQLNKKYKGFTFQICEANS